MPTENRSNDTDGWIACDDGLHLIQMDKNLSHYGWVFRKVDGGLPYSVRKATPHEMAHAQARQHLRVGVAQIAGQAPAPQPHPEPIAWMVGTAIWWTKEEAERDAAETGLPIVGLGPMTGAAPAEQQQGEPVAWLAKTLKGSLAGTLGLARYDQRLNPELYDGPFPVFRHADPGEVERLREGIAKHWKVVCDQRAEIESLRDQLAKVVRSGALTAPEHEALEAECCALSATAEPSAPVAHA